MSKQKCYSVRLESLIAVSEKAQKATAYDGSTAIIPTSCIFGQDYEVQKSDAFWIAAFILEKSGLQYSSKKVRWFESDFKKKVEEVKEEVKEKKEEVSRLVKGYWLEWKEVRIPINSYGKLATRNRQHIRIYEGPENKAPKSFVELSDQQFEIAKTKEGRMIEPYSTPSFA